MIRSNLNSEKKIVDIQKEIAKLGISLAKQDNHESILELVFNANTIAILLICVTRLYNDSMNLSFASMLLSISLVWLSFLRVRSNKRINKLIRKKTLLEYELKDTCK